MTCPNPECGSLIDNCYLEDDCPDCGCYLYPTAPAGEREKPPGRKDSVRDNLGRFRCVDPEGDWIREMEEAA